MANRKISAGRVFGAGFSGGLSGGIPIRAIPYPGGKRVEVGVVDSGPVSRR